LRAGPEDHGRCVIRLQAHGKPKVDHRACGHVPQACCPGTDPEARLEQEIVVLAGRAVAADGHVGNPQPPRYLRPVGVHTPTGYGFFLTHVPPRLGPRQVADLSRVRWKVERSLRLDTSGQRVDHMDAERPCAVQALRQVSRIAALSAALLAHAHTRQTRPAPEGAPRTEAPRHPRRLAVPVAVACQSSAQACDLKGAQAMRRGQEIAALLMPSGHDPHWRRRPSVLDQLRGWTRQPVGRTQPNRNDLKAAAYVDTYARGPLAIIFHSAVYVYVYMPRVTPPYGLGGVPWQQKF
jgi:hypothetical protein